MPGDKGKTDADEALNKKIRAAFKAAKDQDVVKQSDDVKLITENGKVKLQGTVNSNSAKQEIATIARREAGLTKVDNEVKVEERVGGESEKR
jgi:osmotically-inducible protein OsmY